MSEHAGQWISQRSGRAPFFLYLAYTAPHWPLHAPEHDIARYADTYRQGWDVLRERRRQRLLDEGILGESAALSERDPAQPAWSDAPDKRMGGAADGGLRRHGRPRWTGASARSWTPSRRAATWTGPW